MLVAGAGGGPNYEGVWAKYMHYIYLISNKC